MLAYQILMGSSMPKSIRKLYSLRDFFYTKMDCQEKNTAWRASKLFGRTGAAIRVCVDFCTSFRLEGLSHMWCRWVGVTHTFYLFRSALSCDCAVQRRRLKWMDGWMNTFVAWFANWGNEKMRAPYYSQCARRPPVERTSAGNARVCVY